MKNKIRKHNAVSFYLTGISASAFMAIVATLTDAGYIVNTNNLYKYDDDDNLFSVEFDLNLTARFHVYGVPSDWNRMHKAAAAIYSAFKSDLLARSYSCGSIGIMFFRDSDGELINSYTVFSADYSAGNSEYGSIRYARLR